MRACRRQPRHHQLGQHAGLGHRRVDRHGGTTSNKATITFPAPTANWGSITHFALYDASTAGNMLFCAALTTSKTVNNGDAAPSFVVDALTVQVDN
jgi:hypothetical protein